MTKRALVLTGGGDCPGLNAVIRAIVKRANLEKNWEVLGSINAFDGILNEPNEIVVLDAQKVAGIHVRGGTIIGTTNKGGPLAWPIKDNQGNWSTVDRSDELIRRLQYLGVDAVINIGGDGSQRISQALYEKGLNIIGVPKTIDNDLSSTDYTFGFQTAVDVATDAVDKLVTTAASHNRILILEVMGRYAGWIALHSAIAGGAEVCLIPEIPYDLNKIYEKLSRRINRGRGFAIIVIAEGARAKDGSISYKNADEIGYQNKKLGGAGDRLMEELKQFDLGVDIRVTNLGHIQRGGSPCAFDRILATQFGVAAFELILEKKFGHMVAYNYPNIVAVPIQEAIEKYNYIDLSSELIKTARGLDMNLGD
ncbi:MAG: ATP-dependent 6-phosphofructokinase [Candidatus Cloacimonetes bacterium]|nr:ATP-dependent 6-phosphofructokinase [Candidatus Cloacimonadota bacterium]